METGIGSKIDLDGLPYGLIRGEYRGIVGQMVLKLAIARVGKDAIGVRYSYHILNSAFGGSDTANNSSIFFSRRAKEI